MQITCRRCGARGPFSAVRTVREIRDVIDENGEPIDDDWEFANPTNTPTAINCGSCGHSWTTRRDMDRMSRWTR